MSLQVLNGVRFHDPDLLRLTEAMMEFRPVILEFAKHAEQRWVAYRCVSKIDAALEEGSRAKDVLLAVHEELWERQRKVREPYAQRDPAIDVDFSIVAMPFEGALYGVVFTEQRTFDGTFAALGLTDPYWYNGSGDCPEEIEQDDWDRRAEVWQALLKRSTTGAWSACGVTFEFPAPTSFYHAKDILPHIPDIEWRLRRLAVNRTEGAEYGRRTAGMTLDKPDFAISIACRQWLKTEEGQAAILEEIERLRPKIEAITKDHLVKY